MLNGRNIRLLAGLALAGILCVGPSRADTIDPNDDGSQYAFAENLGWLNAEPSGDGGPGIVVGDFELTGYLWSENSGWISLSCINTGSCGTASYGVTNDGHGILAGFAWSENAGWIDFAPATAGVTIDPSTGDFAGRAWGENVGWITFADDDPVTYKTTTGWCQLTSDVSGVGPELSLDRSGADTLLSWTSQANAQWYELVQGDLTTLRTTGGDFGAGVVGCAADNLTATFTVVPLELSPGEAAWFLVRGVNCRGKGSYDSGGIGQDGLRDGEFAATASDCP